MPEIDALAASFPARTCRDEIAFYGGSFTALPLAVIECYLTFARDLKRAGRVKKIRLSTHPAHVDRNVAGMLRDYEVDTVELGIQSLNDEVLSIAKRGHSSDDALMALQCLKDADFEVGVQVMAGLPGDSRETFLATVSALLPLEPDFARIYPLLVLKGTEVAAMMERGDYVPLTLAEAVTQVRDALALFLFAGVPVIRMGLQPTADLCRDGDVLLSGPFHESFGHLVKCDLKRAQIAMLLTDVREGEVLLRCPPRDVALVYGDRGETVSTLRQRYHLRVSRDEALSPGELALKTAGAEMTLTERDFLQRYLDKMDGKSCI